MASLLLAFTSASDCDVVPTAARARESRGAATPDVAVMTTGLCVGGWVAATEFLELFFFFFFFDHMACGILVPRPGIEPGPSAGRVRSPNHCGQGISSWNCYGKKMTSSLNSPLKSRLESQRDSTEP